MLGFKAIYGQFANYEHLKLSPTSDLLKLGKSYK